MVVLIVTGDGVSAVVLPVASLLVTASGDRGVTIALYVVILHEVAALGGPVHTSLKCSKLAQGKVTVWAGGGKRRAEQQHSRYVSQQLLHAA